MNKGGTSDVVTGEPSTSQPLVAGEKPNQDPARRTDQANLVGRTLESIPPPVLVLLGIVSVQVGAALAKHLFTVAGTLSRPSHKKMFKSTRSEVFFARSVL